MKFPSVFILYLCTVLGRVVCSGKGASWDYGGHNGPEHWAEHYHTCSETRQSPVDLLKVAEDHTSAFKWGNYDVRPDKISFKNNGHTVQLNMYTSKPAVVSRGGLGGRYEFLQLHFHWGSDDSRGSEHTVDGKRFPMEMHLVHWNKKYGSVSKALEHEDGLAVVGVFFKTTDKDNENFKEIVDTLSKIRKAGSSSTLSSVFTLKSLLPDETDEFFRYQGSLTTPSCNEVVTWTVLDTPVEISATQMSEFRKVLNAHGKPLVDNFRPVQPLNDRKVVKYSTED